MSNNLTTKDKWEEVWKNIRLPYVTTPHYDIKDQIESCLPKTNQYSLIEVGCAPGGWMAWFNKVFGYKVTGIEYAESAASTTRKNLVMQGVHAEIFVQDFFAWDFEPSKYDVVFSGGFIEHFRDMPPVIDRICGLSRRFVITIVPNLYGINGAIRRIFCPEVCAEHNVIDVSMLESLHTRCGIRTLFCDFVADVHLIRPFGYYRFIREHRYCGRFVHAPVIGFNRLSMSLGKLLKYSHRSRMLSSSLIYIGEKA